VASNAARLGADVMTLVADATAPSVRPGSFARVLVDAPCSGLGALRRRADARWRVQADAVAPLAALQRRILEATAPLVAAGGMLVYSVCTLTAEESVEHPVPEGFELVDDDPGAPWRRFGSGWIVLPHDADTDGMVLVRYRRRT
jgi:16S rRNA (cytosine967-C5)-methyltransferase